MQFCIFISYAHSKMTDTTQAADTGQLFLPYVVLVLDSPASPNLLTDTDTKWTKCCYCY